MLKAKRALISVFDKSRLVDFAKGLERLGVQILSTGGTFRVLEGAGLAPVRVADVTGYPEILDGRVKTLHPKIHGGILADRSRAAHIAALRDHGISPIDIVVVNLYPFRTAAGQRGTTVEKVVEMIDIGGPTMVRAAAKNYQGVLVVVDPGDYPQVLAALEDGAGQVPETLRRQLAMKAFRHTQAYDAAIAAWLEQLGDAEEKTLPPHLLLDLQRVADLRYGENPHQEAALYRVEGGRGVLGGYRLLQGKPLSFNNLLDAEAARRLASAFATPAAAVIKHGNPCGVGRGDDLAAAYGRALATDPDSAFGSVVALNGPVDEEVAAAVAARFVEVLLAPAFAAEALTRLAAKPALRLLECPLWTGQPGDLELRALDGGFVVQDVDLADDDPETWSCPTRRAPSAGERAALALAWRVCRHVRSNAIVVANGDQTVGIGAGQMSRVDACRLAVGKARLALDGTAAASDGFFPFRDGLDVLADAGVTAVVQPGGSKRDPEVVSAADEKGVAMLLTGRRHFKH